MVAIPITRIATIALTHTGLSRQTARFQARSAFTVVGYTTSESEKLVNHPKEKEEDQKAEAASLKREQ